VLVVGAAQSGADIALEIARAGHETWLSGRRMPEVPVPFGSRRMRIHGSIKKPSARNHSGACVDAGLVGAGVVGVGSTG